MPGYEDVSAICVRCRYADRGMTSWPCRCCTVANQMGNYFEEADTDAEETEKQQSTIGGKYGT